MKLHLEIITPEKISLSEEVDEVIIPTADGVIGILPSHVPLVSKVIPGELQLKKNDVFLSVAVLGGFLEVSKKHVTILTNYAIEAKNIELAKAEQAKERAEKLMQEKLSDEDFVVAQSVLQRAILELKVARRHKTRQNN